MFFTLAQRKNERDIHPLQGYALVTFFSTHPTLSYRNRGSQPIPQTPLTTSSSVTIRDSLSELGSPLAAPSVVPLQGRDLTAPPVALTFLRPFGSKRRKASSEGTLGPSKVRRVFYRLTLGEIQRDPYIPSNI